jgi:DNA-binding MarR family transcriptional regulator
MKSRANADPAVATLRQTNTGRLLLKAMRAFNEQSMAAIRALGHADLSLAHAAVLPHIDVAGTRLTDVAERAGLRKQSASQLVDELVAADYVIKRSDPADKRASLISFTKKGRQFLEHAAGVKQDIEDGLEEALGTASYQELRRLLEALPAASAKAQDRGSQSSAWAV